MGGVGSTGNTTDPKWVAGRARPVAFTPASEIEYSVTPVSAVMMTERRGFAVYQ